MADLDAFKNHLSRLAHGMTKAEAHEAKICVRCKESPEFKTHSEAGRKEYLVSGLCEECFNELTKQ